MWIRSAVCRSSQRLLQNVFKATNRPSLILISRRRVQTLVSTNWLLDALRSSGSQQLRVLDASFVADKKLDTYSEVYKAEHIPEASFFDLHKCVTSTPFVPRNIPDLNCLEKYIQGLGIFPDTHIVTYDRDDAKGAVRTWWTFRLLGHKNISVLDGGMIKWKADGYETTDKEPETKTSGFSIKYNIQLIREMGAILANLKLDQYTLVDARGSPSFTGEKEENNPDVKQGHIPGSKNVPFADLFNDKDGTFKSPEQLRQLFSDSNIDLSQPLVAMCQTGVTACGISLACHLLEGTDIPVYSGSWSEWGQLAPSNMCVKGKA